MSDPREALTQEVERMAALLQYDKVLNRSAAKDSWIARLLAGREMRIEREMEDAMPQMAARQWILREKEMP